MKHFYPTAVAIGLFLLAGGTVRCTDGQPSRHESATMCTEFCSQNGMEVANWNGEYPSKSCPNCGCMCKPRTLTP